MNRRNIIHHLLHSLPVAAFFTGLLPTMTYAHPTQCRPNIIGEWKIKTLFHAGGIRAGQFETGTFRFLKGDDDKSGAVVVSIDGLQPIGHGYWWSVNGGITYCFLEPVCINGQYLQVLVNHTVIALDSHSFQSQGQGNVYAFPNEQLTELPVLFISKTSTEAKRLT